MKLQIENAKTTFFNSKDEYLAFRKAWSTAVNSPDAKPRVEEIQRKNYYSGSMELVRLRIKGNLTATHHLIFNLLRGKDMTAGFTPVTNETKLRNGMAINHGLYEARYTLGRLATNIKAHNGNREWITKFLAPFNGTVTPEMIVKLDELTPDFQTIDPGFGRGKKVAEAIIKDKKHLSMNDVYALYEEVA